jgi:hypothetical protein
MTGYSIPSLSFFEMVILPAFADLVPAGFPFQGTLNEFTIMDNVVSKRPIVDIKRVQNILQRRDASCDINYKKVAGASTRQIAVEELYAATQFCRNEFYQGCLKEYRAKDPLFGSKILPWFQGSVNADIASNAYFGDIERVAPPNAIWSTTVFDGIFKWIKKYITAGAIPSSQTIAIADGTDYTSNATAAYNLLNGMYNKQSVMMDAFMDSQKAFYVSKDIATGLEDYYINTGTTAQGYSLLANGIKQLTFKGIPVLVEPIWKPIISELKGSVGHAAILTLRGNFVFATDKDYGEGPDGKTALRVWYDDELETWKYKLYLKAGTQVALPEFIVIALSSWS